jgi:hypothetical protein
LSTAALSIMTRTSSIDGSSQSANVPTVTSATISTADFFVGLRTFLDRRSLMKYFVLIAAVPNDP